MLDYPIHTSNHSSTGEANPDEANQSFNPNAPEDFNKKYAQKVQADQFDTSSVTSSQAPLTANDAQRRFLSDFTKYLSRSPKPATKLATDSVFDTAYQAKADAYAKKTSVTQKTLLQQAIKDLEAQLKNRKISWRNPRNINYQMRQLDKRIQAVQKKIGGYQRQIKDLQQVGKLRSAKKELDGLQHIKALIKRYIALNKTLKNIEDNEAIAESATENSAKSPTNQKIAPPKNKAEAEAMGLGWGLKGGMRGSISNSRKREFFSK